MKKPEKNAKKKKATIKRALKRFVRLKKTKALKHKKREALLNKRKIDKAKQDAKHKEMMDNFLKSKFSR